MKKIVLLFSLFALTFVSCEGPMGPPGEPGDGMYWFVETYTIKANQWELVGGKNQLNSYFRAEILVPELTDRIYEDGNVFCYMFQNIDGTEVQTLLPFTLPVGEDLGGGKENLWTETFACDFAPGSIMFYVNYSDFITSENPGTITFRVVLNY